MGTVTALKRILARGDDVEAIVAELAELRTAIAAQRDEAKRHGEAWLQASSQVEAERHDRARREAKRLTERDEAKVAELEERLVAAKAERQRAAIARHQAIWRRLFPKLRAALEAAAEVQAEAISAREGAIAEIGEGIAFSHLPLLIFRGLLFPDMIARWAGEMERVLAGMKPPPIPAPAKPAPPLSPEERALLAEKAKTLPNGFSHQMARTGVPPAPPTPPPSPPAAAAVPRELRNDPVPAPRSGYRLVEFLRGGAELEPGLHAMRGDRVAVPEMQAIMLLKNGAVTEVRP